MKTKDNGFKEQKGMEELEIIAVSLTDDFITRKLVERFVE